MEVEENIAVSDFNTGEFLIAVYDRKSYIRELMSSTQNAHAAVLHETSWPQVVELSKET